MLAWILGLLTPTTALVFVVTVLLVYYVKAMPRVMNMPPGPFPLPIVGNLTELIKDTKNLPHPFHDLTKKYGKLYTILVGKQYFVVISDYNLLMEAYVKKANVFSHRPIEEFHYVKDLNDEIGSGLIFNDGDSWKQLRRTTLSALRDFGVGKLSIEEKIHEEVVCVLDIIEEQKGHPYNIKPLCHLATSNVICGLMFGSRFDYADPTFKELLRVLDISFNTNPFFQLDNFFPFLKHLPYFKKIAKAYKIVNEDTVDFIKELTSSREGSFDPENIRDFVDIFIKTSKEPNNGKHYDARNMRRVISDLFTAASDTTANALSWSMLFMAKYPHVQARCQKEIEEVLGKAKKITGADKGKLPYVEATLMEMLRIKPIAPLGLFHTCKKDGEIGGYHIPKGTLLCPDVWAIHRDPETFPDPEEFKPEHFLNDQGEIVNRERMVVFSVGPRSCPGENMGMLELLFFFVSVLQFYTIGPAPGQDVDMTPVYTLMTQHKPQELVFTRRD